MIGIQLCGCKTFAIADLFLPLDLSLLFSIAPGVDIDIAVTDNAAAHSDGHMAAGLGAGVDIHAVDTAAYLVHGPVLRECHRKIWQQKGVSNGDVDRRL